MKTYKDIASDGGSNVAGQVAAQRDRLNERLASIRHIVAVMSGKGGVGKSSVAVNLASALAVDGSAVAIVDADVNGSSIPKMTGVRGHALARGTTGMIPPKSELGVKVMSIDLHLQNDQDPVLWEAPTQRDAYTWRAMMEMVAVREFLSDTEWGTLDFLFIDLPPGTDRLPNVVDLLPRISGTLIVTIPSAVSLFVVRKSIRMAREISRTPLLGIIENMSAHVCPECGRTEALFTGGDVERLADDEGVPYLGAIPFDPRIAAAADDEESFLARYADTPAGTKIRRIAGDIQKALEARR